MASRTTPAEHAAISQFGTELRRLRELSDISQKDLGDQTGTSKQQIGAVERGIRKPSKKFAELADRALDAHGGLLSMWPGAKRAQPWWLDKFVELEAKAQVISDFQPQAISGLLQTENYARALINAAFPPLQAEDAEERLAGRLERQQVLLRADPPLALFIVDEAVLRRPVGGEAVMREQREALLSRAQLPHVHLQVLPFSRGAHGAMNGPLILLNMTHSESLVYAEAPGTGQVITDAQLVATCHLRFGSLRSLALSPSESLDFIASM